MSKVTLTNLANLQNETTAVNAINANNAAITTAIENTLSRDGTSPNQMLASIDMNSKHILNLPQPLQLQEPLRLQDLNTFIGGGTISTIPAGGLMNNILIKNSNLDYDVSWASQGSIFVGQVLSRVNDTNITMTLGGTPATSVLNAVSMTLGWSGTLSAVRGGFGADVSAAAGVPLFAAGVPTFTSTSGTGNFVRVTSPTLVTPTLGVATATSINKVALTAPATSATLTISDGKTLASTSSLTFSGTDSTTITFQATDTYVGRSTTDTLINKSISGSTNTLTNIGGASIRMGVDAQGDILYFNGTNYVRLAAGTTGQFLKTQGSSLNPVWATISGGGDMLSANNLSDVASIITAKVNLNTIAHVKRQIFTGSGTYTPATGLIYCIIEAVGGGGAGGAAVGSTGTVMAAGGGGSGGYSRLVATAATIGASKTVTIGAGGTAGGGAAGGNGGDTSVGALCIAKGGGGGGRAQNGASVPVAGPGGTTGTGDIIATGNAGGGGMYNPTNTTILVPAGNGGASYFGGGPSGQPIDSTGNGGLNYGAGGAGGFLVNNVATLNGGAGAAGVVYITEFTNQ